MGRKDSNQTKNKQWNYIMGRDMRKPVFGVSVKARFKPVSSATETT